MQLSNSQRWTYAWLHPWVCPYFLINIRFSLVKITKVFSRLVTGLSEKVWSFRFSELYLHELWTKNNFFRFSLKKIQLHSIFWNESPNTPFFTCSHALFHNFSLLQFFFLYVPFFLYFCKWRGFIFSKTIQNSGGVCHPYWHPLSFTKSPT